MSIVGGMGMFGGSSFLNAMGSQHGETQANRLMRPYSNWDTPWGKGPYWDKDYAEKTRLSAEAREDTKYQRSVADAKAAGLHPLFALGASGPGGGGGISVGGGSRPGPQISRGSGSAPSVALRNKFAEKRAQEEHEINMERGAIENLKAASELAILNQRLAAGDITVPDYKNVPEMEQAPKMTRKEIMRGPFGGAYRMPEGVSPADAWEQRVGEGSDWIMGPGIMARMYADRRKRLNRMRNQKQAVKRYRSNKRNVERSKKSLFNKWFRSGK